MIGQPWTCAFRTMMKMRCRDVGASSSTSSSLASSLSSLLILSGSSSSASITFGRTHGNRYINLSNMSKRVSHDSNIRSHFFSTMANRRRQSPHACQMSVERPALHKSIIRDRAMHRLFSTNSTSGSQGRYTLSGIREILTRALSSVRLSSPLASSVKSSLTGFSIRDGASNARRAMILRLQAFYRTHSFSIIAGVAAVSALLMWRIMYGTANLFINLSETMAEMGFLVMSFSVAGLGVVLLRYRYALDPNEIYRLSMRELNKDPRILELLGAPLSGTELRAFIMSGGHLRVQNNFLPKLSSKRCHLIFPLQGSNMRGIVSAEAKKKNGSYHFKLLSVDVPITSNPTSSSALAGTMGEQKYDHYRIFLHGSQKEYDKGNLVSELRDPFIAAAELQNDYDAEDDIEDYDEMMTRKQKMMENQPKALNEGGGMYLWEQAYETLILVTGNLRSAISRVARRQQEGKS